MNKHFAVVIVAVGVVSVPFYFSKFPPTVIHVRRVSALLGWMLYTIFGYVTFFVANETSYFGIKYIVLVPYILFLTPWAKCPNLLATDFVQISLSSPLIMWKNSWSTPVSGLRTALASKLYRCSLESGRSEERRVVFRSTAF